MLLALSVVSEQGTSLGTAAYKIFDERGGSIGRVAGNDWVLPDAQNFVSSRHARVSATAGVFFLEDTSSNGTFINAPDRLASRTEPQRLTDGDRLYIGDYEIIVQLIPSAPAEMAARAPAPTMADATRLQAPAASRSPAPAALLPPPSALGLGTVDPLAALGAAAAGSAAGIADPLAAFDGGASGASGPLAALGIDASRVDADVQAALLAGLRAGFNALLTKLDPQQLEELYERKLERTAMLPLGGNKAKYWEMYRAQFEEIARDRDAHFRELFGEQFALAYNDQLRKLADAARPSGPR
ncbi:MAG: type VI secretion system-associated FHA domain protein [Gammaproteobacteria bacterium]